MSTNIPSQLIVIILAIRLFLKLKEYIIREWRLAFRTHKATIVEMLAQGRDGAFLADLCSTAKACVFHGYGAIVVTDAVELCLVFFAICAI